MGLSPVYATDDRKALKVTLPIRQHIRLRTLKLLTDRTMSEITEEAVDRYLDQLEELDEVEDDISRRAEAA